MELPVEKVLLRAITAHKEGQHQVAEGLYRDILQAQPLHPDANHNLGMLLVSVDKAAAALPLLETALRANPTVEQFWLSYISVLNKEKQFDIAEQALDRAEAHGIDLRRLDLLKAKCSSEPQKLKTDSLSPPQEQLSHIFELYQAGRFSEAEKFAISITEDFPKHQFGWKALGAALKQLGRIADSLAPSQKSAQLAPNDAEAHSNLGNTLQELGRVDEAEACYARAIVLNPLYSEAHYNLGVTLFQQGRLDEAVASLAKAIKIKPDFPEAHNNLGNTLKELGRLNEAEASYNKAIVLAPDFDDALANRGHIFFEKGEYESALRDADTCVFNERSGALALESLLALRRIDDIHTRLEVMYNHVPGNISLAAFSSFISSVEGKSTANNFCPNPLNFLYTANLSSHVDDVAKYTKNVIEELHGIRTVGDPPGKTTVNGFQTPTNMDLFANPSKAIAKLKSIILNQIAAYYLKFKSEECFYIENFPTTQNIFGWVVVLKQQGHQDAHIHTSGWLSGVIYLKVVPSLGRNEGAIEFSLNGKNYQSRMSPCLTFQPEAGDIVLFPSSLHHKTIPFTTDTDRIIVSFDLIPG